MEPLFVVRVALLLVVFSAGTSALVHKTIQRDHGDVIDCVDINQQPALKDVADHDSRKIQAMKPQRSMKEIVSSSGINGTSSRRLKQAHQTWRERGSCPAGTVPIRRPAANADEAAAEAGRRAFSHGHPHFSNRSATLNDWPGIPGTLEVAAGYATNGPYHGGRANIPIWQVEVRPGELSMNYIMVGYTLDQDYTPYPSADPPKTLTNQIVVGLVNDGGNNNNCFNLDCGGFHLVNSSYALGIGWNGDSQPGGDKYIVTISIHRDDTSFQWWVSVMDEAIGYYPEGVFDTRFPEAGGRVVDTRPGGAHTSTPMGNGIPACGGGLFAATVFEYLGISANGELFNDANPLGVDDKRPGYYVAYGRRRRDL